ncbi:MAG: hypothetical protein Dbin4_02134 [Alphaproteobacteria bacterium]|nr:hypothetical protein [Alphaproteobacteria bacterium]
MNSSISSSENTGEPGWRGFARWFFGGGIGLGLLLYLLIILIDPFDTLPLSPPLDRVPIASNARYSFPALARKPDYDSVVIGTSTARLLRPEMLNGLFSARFANLSMNSATAYEQTRLLEVFTRHHAAAKAVIVGIDVVWCEAGETIEKYTPRPFPEWMYDSNPFNDYLYQFNLYTIEQAGRQAGTMLGLRRLKYGRDGYTSFLPDLAAYDLTKVQASLAVSRANAQAETKAPQGFDPAGINFPALSMLRTMLGALPPHTQKILFMAPYHHARQSLPDSISGMEWAECKKRVGAIVAQTPNTIAADFMIKSPFTTTDTNYWDPVHYSVEAAAILMSDLASAAQGKPGANYVLLGK